MDKVEQVANTIKARGPEAVEFSRGYLAYHEGMSYGLAAHYSDSFWCGYIAAKRGL